MILDCIPEYITPECFLLVDLQKFFFQIHGKKEEKKL